MNIDPLHLVTECKSPERLELFGFLLVLTARLASSTMAFCLAMRLRQPAQIGFPVAAMTAASDLQGSPIGRVWAPIRQVRNPVTVPFRLKRGYIYPFARLIPPITRVSR